MKMEKINMKNSKALSPLIATVLLILLSIAGISIIAGVIIPFVREKMQEAKECSEIIEISDSLLIDSENGYACYDENNDVKITIHRGDIEIIGIRVAVRGGGDSKVEEITENLPQKGGEKTYIIETNLETIQSAIIAPIMSSGKICKETDEIELIVCE